ncbi:MAG: DUF5110 domain-containing protein [Candidatus Latescibacteria bacterium]|nr:DUF5110 domain-containing protein [bacterium]MBD3423678.1 DUF5110 domain-containing protein [Candidatus Latescibacterota bacterium]
MRRYLYVLCFALIILLSLQAAAEAGAARHSALIDENIAVFYPPGFVPERVMPSFALVREFREIGKVPEDWEVIPGFEMEGDQFGVHFPVQRGTSLYGTGEVTGPLVRNGTVRTLWNTDNWTYSRFGGNQLYQSHPWVLAVRINGSAYGILCDSTWRMKIDLRDGIKFLSGGAPFRVIVIQRDSPQGVMRALGNLTGTIELPPLWALGYQQCRYSYYPDSRVREVADRFRELRMPCDVIWHDIHYMDGFRVFTFDRNRFPDPSATNRYLHERGFKTVWMIDPGVKAESGYFVYDSGTQLDIWTRTAGGRNFVGRVWPGDCVFPDFTMPAARLWWASLYQRFMETGVDGVWNDMNEPALFGTETGTMPEDNLHRGGGEIPPGTHARYHNVYGMLMVRATRLGIRMVNPERRPFVLTRANYLGGQRYAATWTGDNRASWEHLKISIPMSLNLSLSGQPFNGPDIGGFDGNATPELFGHWIAVGAFYPFCRAHTAVNTRNQEPWEFGQDIEIVARRALERRYRLLPYIYTLFRESSVSGMPVMRPVFFADPVDPALRREQEAFLLGDRLLVIPAWADDPALPDGLWRSIDLDPGSGGHHANRAIQPELRLKGGSILPAGPLVQSTDGYRLAPLTLMVCLDAEGSAIGDLYEDDWEGYGYRGGDYLLTRYRASSCGDTVKVNAEARSGLMKTPEREIRAILFTGRGTFRGAGTERGGVVIPLN